MQAHDRESETERDLEKESERETDRPTDRQTARQKESRFGARWALTARITMESGELDLGRLKFSWPMTRLNSADTAGNPDGKPAPSAREDRGPLKSIDAG